MAKPTRKRTTDPATASVLEPMIDPRSANPPRSMHGAPINQRNIPRIPIRLASNRLGRRYRGFATGFAYGSTGGGDGDSGLPMSLLKVCGRQTDTILLEESRTFRAQNRGTRLQARVSNEDMGRKPMPQSRGARSETPSAAGRLRSTTNNCTKKKRHGLKPAS